MPWATSNISKRFSISCSTKAGALRFYKENRGTFLWKTSNRAHPEQPVPFLSVSVFPKELRLAVWDFTKKVGVHIHEKHPIHTHTFQKWRPYARVHVQTTACPWTRPHARTDYSRPVGTPVRPHICSPANQRATKFPLCSFQVPSSHPGAARWSGKPLTGGTRQMGCQRATDKIYFVHTLFYYILWILFDVIFNIIQHDVKKDLGKTIKETVCEWNIASH